MQDHEWAQALEQRRHTVRQQVSAEEWAAREDLAACYRLCVHYRMTDMIYNHISLRVPGTHDQFLINAFGLLYEEVSASNLVKIDVAGMEPRALRGLERHLKRHRPSIVSEFHPQAMRAASGVEAIDYLRWLRGFHPAITVLHRDGRRERCGDEQGVIDAWRAANAAAGLDGALHLDIALERE